jgi:hypothetical protein
MIQATDYTGTAGGTFDRARANHKEYVIDVFIALRSIVPPNKRDNLGRIWASFVTPCADDIEQERLGIKMLGSEKMGWDQRLGAELIRRKLFPPKGYFNVIKRGNRHRVASTDSQQRKYYSRYADSMLHGWEQMNQDYETRQKNASPIAPVETIQEPELDVVTPEAESYLAPLPAPEFEQMKAAGVL